MKKNTIKFVGLMLATVGILFFGCTTSSSGTDTPIDDEIFQKNEAKKMWARMDALGIAGYFDSLSQTENPPVINVSSLINSHCPSPALAMDENTRYLDELETLFDEGEQVKGVCGNALKLNDGQVAPLGVNLIDSMRIGTIEFWFRPNEDFYDQKARTLIGNDGARIHFFYKDGELYFQKNHHNQHFFVQGTAELKDDWNLIAGQWGDGYMSVWLNGKMVARWEHSMGYAPATRGIPFENLVVIGYKSSCCMEGVSQYVGMTTSGSFDQFRISNIPRYKMENVLVEDEFSDSLEVPESSSSSEYLSFSSSSEMLESSSSFEIFSSSAAQEKKNSLWTTFYLYGVSAYFDTTALPQVSAFVSERCAAPALVMDEQTLFFDELETIYQEGELVDGVCGKAIMLKDGEVAPLGINLVDSISEGTVEFWFRPGSDFGEKSARTLLGSDESRIQFLYVDGKLIFQENLADAHFYVRGEVQLENDWNLIAGQWGNGSMSLWLNGEKIAEKVRSDGYIPSNRNKTFSNLLVVGYKSSCCMEGPGVFEALTTSGTYDQLRISSVPRY